MAKPLTEIMFCRDLISNREREPFRVQFVLRFHSLFPVHSLCCRLKLNSTMMICAIASSENPKNVLNCTYCVITVNNVILIG